MRVRELRFMQPNPWDDGDPAPQNRPESVIVGLPQQQLGSQMGQQMGQQIIYYSEESSSPKVLGIFVIIWGAFSFLGIFTILLLPTEDPFTGEKLVVPLLPLVLGIINSLIVAFTCIVGGYWMTLYQRRGIHLVLLGIIVSFFIGLASILLGGDGGLGEILGNEQAAIAINTIAQGICSVICGLIVAIPLMSSAQGLDGSSLFGQLK